MTREARRRWLFGLMAALAAAREPAARVRPVAAYPDVVPGTPPTFPTDHGAHDAYRTEWWYVTGWLRRLDGPHRNQPAGVQITFFRTRTRHDRANPSRFAPVQLLFAHAALALPERGSLLHAQRAAREGLGLARASRTDTDVAIGDWSLVRDFGDVYRTHVDDDALAIDLAFRAHAAPLLQGDAGFSRKGPRETQASRYYSRPQLEVRGHAGEAGERVAVDGVAWLDHEWSSEILDASAVGWDWAGLNLDDGSALMAFRIRTREGGTLWRDAKWASPAARPRAPSDERQWDTQRIDAAQIRFEELRRWTSPRTGVQYPVAMRVTVGARSLTLEPLFDDQELDTRATTGVVYWEGAVRVLENGAVVGRGYLELTGYEARVRF